MRRDCLGRVLERDPRQAEHLEVSTSTAQLSFSHPLLKGGGNGPLGPLEPKWLTFCANLDKRGPVSDQRRHLRCGIIVFLGSPLRMSSGCASHTHVSLAFASASGAACTGAGVCMCVCQAHEQSARSLRTSGGVLLRGDSRWASDRLRTPQDVGRCSKGCLPMGVRSP